MAFDNHCKMIGYEMALPLIEEWLDSDCANVRRAVSEGLRIWTSRPYFNQHPQVAIDLLSAHKEDESEYVRKSVGNALRDVSKKHPELVSAELSSWSLSSKEVKQVYKRRSDMGSFTDIIDGIYLLDKHESGLLDDKSFLSSFGKVKVFYSTPFGDHKDGDSRLFVLPAQDETAYLPVFTSIERTMEFYEKAGRVGFAIFEDSFTSFLETTKIINEGNTPIKLGAVIDPGYYGVTIDANSLDAVIDMTV